MTLFKISRLAPLLLALEMAACTSVPQQAQQLLQVGQVEGALRLLGDAFKANPNDSELRMALQHQQEQAITLWANRADQALQAGKAEVAHALMSKLEATNPAHPRVKNLRTDMDRVGRHERWLQEASSAYTAGRLDEAENKVNKVLSESRGNAAALLLKFKLGEQAAADKPPKLSAAFQKKVTLEFRDAPLQQVMEALARGTGVNFVFAPEVRPDTRVSIQLNNATIDDAITMVLGASILERKVLNESTLLVYPLAARREYMDFITRNFYLNTVDVKQALVMVKAMAKVKDAHIDERLNLLIVRDTPEIVKLTERLLAAIDIAEPEVMLEVEVIEISSNLKDQLGLQWPTSTSYTNDANSGIIDMSNIGRLSFKISNPALTATFNETAGNGKTLANPRLRVRNKEKAKILIGDKLPVFSSTAVANVGLSTSVSYLEVGLKLDIEPTVSLDGDVTLKIGLEVSSVTNSVTNSQGSTAYQIGTRQASSVIRLRDGETQVFAGLIRDDDSKAINGIPGLARMPLLGRFFGLHTDTYNKTELALFITPRVIRNLQLPEAGVNFGAGGTEANPGAVGMRLAADTIANVPMQKAVPGSMPARGTWTGPLPGRNTGSSPVQLPQQQP